MKHLVFLLLVAVCAALGLAQTGPSGGGSAPYQPAVPRGNYMGGGGGGWPGYGTPTTAAGAAMSGMSQVISAAGQYNLATSAAAVNMTQAQRTAIQNDMLATETYFSMRALNREAREREREPRLSAQQLAKIAMDGAPKPLNPNQVDPISGGLKWPSALQQDNFTSARGQLDQLFAKRARYGGLTYSDQISAKQTVDSMFTELKGQIKSVPPQDYVACRDFLRSLTFAASKSDLR